MKTSILSLILLCGFAIVSFGQESLIADIMNVAPVTIKADETTKEANDDYQKEFDEQKFHEELILEYNDYNLRRKRRTHYYKIKKFVFRILAFFTVVLH